jgi:hypothetical protein
MRSSLLLTSAALVVVRGMFLALSRYSSLNVLAGGNSDVNLWQTPACREAATIIANPGFEDPSFEPWATWQQAPNNSITLVSPGHSSDHAVLLSMPQWRFGQGGPALWQLQIPPCEAVNYQLTFDYKILTTAKNCQLSLFVLREDPPQQ